MRQQQSNEMVDLNKAYADMVILNTVKESAGPVMMPEQRAVMFQQELPSIKEEALQMDAKKAETEKASLEQQRKIEMLEAKLNEAEDLITNLRAELKCAYLELDKTRKHRHAMKSSASRRSKLSFDLNHCPSDWEDEFSAKMKPPLTDVEPVHGSTGVTESDQAVNNFELVEKNIEKDDKFDGSAAQNLTGPSSDMEVVVPDISYTSTTLKDAKSFEENDGSSTQADDKRLLKHTFQKKRKKESSENADQDIDSDKRRMKRRVEDEQNGSLEPHKSRMTQETSTDNWQLAPVAQVRPKVWAFGYDLSARKVYFKSI